MQFKLSGLWQRRVSKTESAGPPVELSFSVTHDYPDKVMEADEPRHRAIGTKGDQTIYSILALNFNKSDELVAKSVKARVINSLLGLQAENPGPEIISKAYSLCLSELNSFKTNERKETIAYLVAHDIIGHGPLSILLEDAASIEEIEINSPCSEITIYHSKYGRCTTNLRFNDEASFRFVLNRLIAAAEKELSSSFPIIDAQLSDGSRVHAQMWPYSIKGTAATIRLNNGKGIDIRKLISSKTVQPVALAYLWLAIESKKNIIVSGAPASGKTSLLLAVNAFAGKKQRILTIEEDINELKFFPNFTNVVPLQGSSRNGAVDLEAQVKNALHMRPERLIIGEIRGREAKVVFSGANLGIPFMTTMHSGANGSTVIGRLVSQPMGVEKHTLSMLDLSLFMMQGAGGNRYLESIVEYGWHSRGEAAIDELDKSSEFGVNLNVIMKNGIIDESALKDSKVIRAYSELNGTTAAVALKELKKRAKFLNAMSNPESANIASHDYVARYQESG